MIEDCYLLVRYKGQLICAGKIVNHKYDSARNQYLYTTDGQYFFFKNKNIDLQLTTEPKEQVNFNPDLYSNLLILPWSDRIKKADIFVEHTVKELDKEIAPLVYAINSMGIDTTGSCSGHNEGPSWVTLSFSDLSSMIYICRMIRRQFPIEEVGLEVPPEFSGETRMNLNLKIPMVNNQINVDKILVLTEFFYTLPSI